MASSARNPQKAKRKIIQKAYSIYFSVAMAVCGVLFIILIASFFIDYNEKQTVLFFAVPIFTVFLPIGIYMRVNNKNRSLKIPSYMPEKAAKVMRSASIFFVFFLGILVFPFSPIKANGNAYIDKRGNEYSYDEYVVYQRWESILFISWEIAFLQTIVFLPFVTDESKKWWKI